MIFLGLLQKNASKLIGKIVTLGFFREISGGMVLTGVIKLVCFILIVFLNQHFEVARGFRKLPEGIVVLYEHRMYMGGS